MAALVAVLATAGLATPAGADLPGEGVDWDAGFEPGPQHSPALAMQPGDPARVAIVETDEGSRPEVLVSDEGMRPGSAVSRRLPRRTDLPGGGTGDLRLCCAAAVAGDPTGNFWVAAASRGNGGRIVVNRVPSGADRLLRVSTGLPKPAGAGRQELPAIAVGAGAVRAVWVDHEGAATKILYSECETGEQTAGCGSPGSWSEPATIAAGSRSLSMPAIDVAPGGGVYAVWWDAGSDNAIEGNRCGAGEDCSGAGSWNEPATIAPLDARDDDADLIPDPLPTSCPIIAAPAGLTNPSPSLEAGPTGRVSVAWSDLRENAGASDPGRCRASGGDATWDSFVATGIAGAFPLPGTGVRLSADPPQATNDHFLPALSVDPSTGDIEASFFTTAGDPAGQLVTRQYVISTDGGADFSEPLTISSAASRFAGTDDDGSDYGVRSGADSTAGVFLTSWTDGRAIQSRDADGYTLGLPARSKILAGPADVESSAVARFRFTTDGPRLQCSLDGAFFQCFSPERVGPLPNGEHTFAVQATDLAGNPVEPTPATRSWTISDLDAPHTRLTRVPGHVVHTERPRFAFVADERGARFECSYDGRPWSSCKRSKSKAVAVGRHRFRVRARDTAGNVDPTPADYRFERRR
jgi:hypothetical protein